MESTLEIVPFFITKRSKARNMQEKYVNRYIINIENGKKTGIGKYFWKDSSKYEGEFENDQPNGEGTFWFADGTIYKGEFKDGTQHGMGY